MNPTAAKPTSALAQLAEVLTNPEVVGGLRSDEISALQSAVSTIQTALGSAFVAALQREMLAAANPRQAIDVLMDADEIAKFLHLTKQNVYGLMRSGELKFVQIGKYKKVSVKTLMDFLWELTRAGNADIPAKVEAFIEHGKKLIRAEAAAKPPRGKSHGYDPER